MAFQFTDANFKKEALEADMPVLVDFYADWCGPCKMMAPIIDELAKEYDGVVKIGKLNVDNNPDTARHYRVMSIPTMIIFKNGAAVDTVVGAVSKNALKEKLDVHK
ncbi:MAG TPA: thioredoxin [Clostridiales bacterium]|jgi:thioredoxin 1|nr:thioredoxin [Clostridiales bacterium]